MKTDHSSGGNCVISDKIEIQPVYLEVLMSARIKAVMMKMFFVKFKEQQNQRFMRKGWECANQFAQIKRSALIWVKTQKLS